LLVNFPMLSNIFVISLGVSVSKLSTEQQSQIVAKWQM
jgi:hypothetical protein